MADGTPSQHHRTLNYMEINEDDNTRSTCHEPDTHTNSSSQNHDLNLNVLKLHIGNIDKSIDERALKNEFMKYGEISEVKIIRRSNKGQPLEKQYGFVTFKDSQHAKTAREESDGLHNWVVAFSKAEKGKIDLKRKREDMCNKNMDRVNNELFIGNVHDSSEAEL